MRAVVNVLSFDLVAKLLLGVLGILLIRYLPTDEYATYTFALSLVAFVTQSVAATFNRIYILTAPRGDAGDAWPVIGLQGAAIALLAALGLPLIAILGSAYGLVVGLVLATCASEFAKTHFQKDLHFSRFSQIELARSGLFFVAAVMLMWHYGSNLTAVHVLVAQAVSLLLVALVALHGRLGVVRGLDATALRGYASRLAAGRYSYLFAYFFVVGVFTQADIFMLKIIGDELMLATYGSAFRYYSILSLALAAVHAVLLPMIRYAESSTELTAIMVRHSRLLLLFAGTTALAAWLSGWFIPWIDAGKYPTATATFRVLCVSAIVSFAFSPHANLLLRYEAFSFLALAILVALLVHVLLCLLLIPVWGAVGAAVSTAVSAALANLAYFFRARQFSGRVAAP